MTSIPILKQRGPCPRPKPDIIARLGRSIIQHGPLSSRVYLMSLAPGDCPDIIPRLEKLARENSYTKIFAVVHAGAVPIFQNAGYMVEAFVPGFFRGREGAGFMGYYLEETRGRPEDASLIQRVLKAAQSKGRTKTGFYPPHAYQVCPMDVSDIDDMATLYSRVFESYPFPVFDPRYLAETMQKNRAMYFGARHEGRLAGLGAASKDMDSLSVELTDFAVLKEHRGKGLAGALLGRMDLETRKMGMLTRYTIARATSYAMNTTFARAGYKFAGTLINNTHIAGKLESMNVWYRPVLQEGGSGINPP